MEVVCLIVVFSCFVQAMLEDAKWKRVHRYLWWIAEVAGMGLLLMHREAFSRVAWELLFFAMIQFLLFSKLYGKADCFCFQCCSMVLGAYGGGLKAYLFHMLITIAILGIVQFYKRNVNAHGDLKEPVALLPYAMPVFFVMWGMLVTINR